VDLKAVRAFVAIAGAGQFQKAAVDLSLTQCFSPALTVRR
jgi:DNA-binding transcriptional LysR family regulator